MDAQKKYFTAQLNEWHQNVNQRSLPWKEEKDPYKIWLSEIILQQTRAEQGLKYYLAFTEYYPTIVELAQARDEDVFRLWQGLGYYNRCKNMLGTARFIAQEFEGQFPNQYKDIIALKGIGAYTAAAIASFAFNLPFAVVDGNVYRVLSRYLGIDTAIDSTEGKRLFSEIAQGLLNHQNPSGHNQAIMDLGATICTPRSPKCADCPLNKKCVALKNDLIQLLPVKTKKLIVQNRFFNFLVLQYKDEIWIERRTEKGIWQNLHQFYLIETSQSIEEQDLVLQTELLDLKLKIRSIKFKSQYKQRLTHQLIESKFYTVQLKSKPDTLSHAGIWISLRDLNNYAFPKTLVDFIESSFTP